MRIVLGLALVMHAALALASDGPVKAVNTGADGLALHGYDAVAYFAEGKPVEGSPAFRVDWNGATWRFATAANRERFLEDPDAYAPQFGGYCAWAVSRNYTADIDPAAFEIAGGKLYLNYSKLVQLRWKMNRDENIRKADANWPKLSQPAKGGK